MKPQISQMTQIKRRKGRGRCHDLLFQEYFCPSAVSSSASAVCEICAICGLSPLPVFRMNGDDFMNGSSRGDAQIALRYIDRHRPHTVSTKNSQYEQFYPPWLDLECERIKKNKS